MNCPTRDAPPRGCCRTPSPPVMRYRASPFAAQCEYGFVNLVDAPWNDTFVEELCSFANGAHDDQVDAASAAFRALVRRPKWQVVARESQGGHGLAGACCLKPVFAPATSAGSHAILNIVGDPVTNVRQLQQFLLGGKIFSLFGQFSVFSGFVSKIVVPVHARPQEFQLARTPKGGRWIFCGVQVHELTRPPVG